MNPDIERILNLLITDRREYAAVDWEASLRARLQDAWNFGYTTGAGDTWKSVTKLVADGSDIAAIVRGIEWVIAHASTDQEEPDL